MYFQNETPTPQIHPQNFIRFVAAEVAMNQVVTSAEKFGKSRIPGWQWAWGAPIFPWRANRVITISWTKSFNENQSKLQYLGWVVVSNIFYFHPYLGKIPILTNIFQMGWNHQLVRDVSQKHCWYPSKWVFYSPDFSVSFCEQKNLKTWGGGEALWVTGKVFKTLVCLEDHPS